MELKDLITKFSDTKENQQKAIFNTIFIVGNKLQTIFDQHIPDISLKQFMLLSTIRHSDSQMTFTQLGELLGCSRQNIKKIASVLEKKGYVKIQTSKEDSRAQCICPTDKVKDFFEDTFDQYQKELKFLFDVYTEEEVEMLFHLMMKLYVGIEHLESAVKDEV